MSAPPSRQAGAAPTGTVYLPCHLAGAFTYPGVRSLARACREFATARDALLPDGTLIRDETAGLSPEQQDEIRRIAVEVLIDVRDGRRSFVDEATKSAFDSHRLFFLTYGPNTNIVVNGSIIYFSECEVHYALGVIEMLLRDDLASADCRQNVHDAYEERSDAGNLKMAWGVSKVNSWYKAESGRVAQNWPFSLLEYWQQTRTPDPADYHLT